MTPESILASKPLILSQQARETYFKQGYSVAFGFLEQSWLPRMRDAYLAADIVGPDVIYRDSMINVKCPGGGGAVAWHPSPTQWKSRGLRPS